MPMTKLYFLTGLLLWKQVASCDKSVMFFFFSLIVILIIAVSYELNDFNQIPRHMLNILQV